MNDWISVHDRLPNKYKKVKVKGFYDNKKSSIYESISMLVKNNVNEHRFSCEYDNIFISHWMPL